MEQLLMFAQSYDMNIYSLIILGICVGIIAGFTGVGGGVIYTPALIMLGLPANTVVGTGLVVIAAQSIIGSIRHYKFGNIDVKLGLFITISALFGVEGGVRIINFVERIGVVDDVVLILSFCLTCAVGLFTLLDCIKTKKKMDNLIKNGDIVPQDLKSSMISEKLQRIKLPPVIHFKTAGISISLWIVIILGFFTGLIIGMLGVGGGFIMMPTLIYIIGVPSFTAVGTSLFHVLFASSYGSIRHIMSGNIQWVVAGILFVTSLSGVWIGAHITRYVKGLSVRYALATIILFSALATLLKIVDSFTGNAIHWLQSGCLVIVFGGLAVAIIIALGLYVMSRRHIQGRKIPIIVKSLISDQ